MLRPATAGGSSAECTKAGTCEERDYKGLHAFPSKNYKGWPSNYKGLSSFPSNITMPDTRECEATHSQEELKARSVGCFQPWYRRRDPGLTPGSGHACALRACALIAVHAHSGHAHVLLFSSLRTPGQPGYSSGLRTAGDSSMPAGPTRLHTRKSDRCLPCMLIVLAAAQRTSASSLFCYRPYCGHRC